MPVRKESSEAALRAAGLILRRRAGREFFSYIPLLEYNPEDYEVLLRRWPTEPFALHLGAFSGPVIEGQDPEETLLTESSVWSQKLARKADLTRGEGIHGRRAVFLSAHGGGSQIDPVSGRPLELGVFLCYVIPITHSESTVVSQFPSSPEYPRFFQLSSILRGMVDGTYKVHPYTREMLSQLDHWLREQHTVPGAINTLFAPSMQKRMKQYVQNPLLAPPPPTSETPPSSPGNEPHPLLSFHSATEDSTVFDTAAFTVAKLNELYSSFECNSVDKIVKNPLFGSGLQFGKPNRLVSNQYFGHGTPDYQAMARREGKWAVQVQGDGLPDWVDLFPLHKCACEGDCGGARVCLTGGMSADERDSDSWAPLHYACWYGELEVVKILVEEGSASLGLQNSSGSTPLHLAAATGHTEVVAYLLKQKGIDRIKTALDSDGKSPLAVSLECRMNDWDGTARLLREAYKTLPPASDSVSTSPSFLSFPPQPLPGEGVGLEGAGLGYRGSLGDLLEEDSRLKNKRTLRRWRVNFMNGQHQVVHFFQGRDTPASDVIQDIYKLINLRREYHSLFALWIVSDSLDLQLGDSDKPLKLISGWPSLLSQYVSTATTKGSNKGEGPTLYLRRNVFIPPPREKMVSDPVALEFLYADAHRHVLTGYYPCSEEEAIYLAGISMQIAYGDHDPGVHRPGFLKEQLSELLPAHMSSSKRRVEFERRVLFKHSEISQLATEDMQLFHVKYLSHCWQWAYYGCIFFNGTLLTRASKITSPKLGRKSNISVNIGINTEGFHIFNRENKTLIQSLSFEGLVSAEKQELVLFRKDPSLNLIIRTKKAALIKTLVTRLTEQYLDTSLYSLSSSAASALEQ